MRRLLAALILFLAACSSSQPEPPSIPDWNAIPPGVSAALCARLQLDGIGTTGTDVDIVKVTQPLASPQALASLGKPRRHAPLTIVHRALPVAAGTSNAGGCSWKLVDALDPERQFDTMVVELSAPVPNPTKPGAGIIARVSLGGTHPAFYWIDLIPRGDTWSVGRIFPLPL